MDKKTANKIYKILEKEYPRAHTELVHTDALQLLVATILSAQCTDERVNKVTLDLFRKYRNAKAFAVARQQDLESDIRSTGFYRNKAGNIIAASNIITEKFRGKVPDTMEDLLCLPGVARKTANIVLYHAFGKTEGVAVDTHVRRVTGRLGFTDNTDPVKIEPDLMALFDRKIWGKLTNVIISHGRSICKARKPLCGECPVKALCRSADKV